MKVRFLFLAFLAGLCFNVSNAQIAAWDFTGENTVATSTAEIYNANMDASASLVRGVGAAASAGANSFRTVGFQNNGISTANTDYFEATLSAATGFQMSLTTIDARFAGTAGYAVTPGVSNQFAYSLDGTTFTLINSPQLLVGTPAMLTQIDVSGISALQNVPATTTIYIRYYASGQTPTGGWGFNSPSAGSYGLAFGGSVTAIPSGKVSAASGPWTTGATWVGGVAPTTAENVTILSGHVVTDSSGISRSTGTTTTVNLGGTLSVSSSYIDSGTTTINGTFAMNSSASPSGNSFVYGASSTLLLNVSGASNIFLGNTSPAWPTGNSPFNVTVNPSPAGAGVVFMASGMARTIAGTLTLSDGFSPLASGLLTINGNAIIQSGGYFDTNSPIYGASSTLTYNSGGTYGRGFEWRSNGVGTIGVTPGYPNNVTVTNGTALDYVNTVTDNVVLDKAIAGTLQINSGSSLTMNTGGVIAGGDLYVGGDLNLAGTLTLGSAVGDDIRISGNINSTGTLNGNNRAVWFTRTSGTQTITANAGIAIPYVVFDSAGNRTVLQGTSTNVTISAPMGGNAISFGSASDIWSIASNSLTIGSTGVSNAISGSGTFSGTTTSNFTLLGTGNFGTIGFTTGFQNLATFSVSRTAGTVGFQLGSNLTVNTNLILSNGHIDLGNNTLTLTATAGVSASANAYVIADVANGTNAALRKNFTTAPGNTSGFTFPIGDGTASDDGSQYSPVTVYGTGGTYSSAHISAAVNDIKHPNYDSVTQYLSRYWDLKTNGITGASVLKANGTYLAVDVNAPAQETNYLSNVWNGTSWSNSGSPVDATNNLTNPNAPYVGIVPITAGATNHLTAGLRNADINAYQGSVASNVSGWTYNFGSVLVGNTNPVTFTIQNVGQQALVLSSASTAPTAPYIYTTAYTNGSVSSGSTRTFVVTFTPAAGGTFTGSIVIPSSDPDEPTYTINFTGVGVVPAADINITGAGNTLTLLNTPQFFTDTMFSAQAVATTSAPKTYTIQNLGNIALNVGTIVFSGANPGDFAVSTAPAASVSAAGSTTFSVTFTPSGAGTRTATITVNSDDPDEPAYVFYLSGTGTDSEIDVFGNGNSIVNGDASPSATDNTLFGAVNVTSGTAVKYFTIFNTGTVTLNLSGVTITGGAAADFTITTAPIVSLPSNTSTVLGITFNPSVSGLRNALVTINNNDSNENPYTFAIQGNGVDYIPCALGANEIIAVQDFELAPASPTMGYSVTQETGAAAFATAGGTAFGASRASQSNKFAGLRSFQVPGHSVSSTSDEKTTTVEFNAVDASAYQDISLTFKLGAYSTNSTQGIDAGTDPNFENCIVYISRDNGATWSQEIDISGNNNSIWDINSAAGSVTWSFDGNNISSPYNVGATSTNTGPRTITLNNIPNSTQLKVRIAMTLDRTDELWAIDDVQFQGKRTATTIWNGTAWSNGAPTPSVKAIINGPYNTTSGSVEACACEINAAVTINSNQFFDIQDNFANNSTITVESSGSIIQHNNDAINTGNNVTVKRTTAPYRKFDYTYWSSPVTNANVGTTFTGWRTDYAFQFATANFMDVLTAATSAAPSDGYDDDGNAWLNIPTSTTMTPAKGYAIMAPTSVVFSPTAIATVTFNGLVNNGVITMPLSQSQNAGVANDDFNLIGNPYPSALSADAFLTQNSVTTSQISGTLYFWTHNTPIAPVPGPNPYNFITADYAMYTLSGGTASGTGSAIPTGKIASCEGFFVEAVNGATQATFDNSMRDKSYNNSQFFRMASPVSETPAGEIDRIWLNFTHANGLFSQQLLAYFPNTTLGFDPAYDGEVSKTQNSVSFYSFIGQDNYRIQARPEFNSSDVVPLGFTVLAPGNYNVAIGQSEGVFIDSQTDVYLEDKLLNIVHNLKEASYSFDTAAGTFNDRFVLRYTDTSLGNPDIEASSANVLVAASNGQIKVKSYTDEINSIVIYDLLGRQVYEMSGIAAEEFVIENAIRNQQALIVKVTLENGAIVNRKIVF